MKLQNECNSCKVLHNRFNLCIPALGICWQCTLGNVRERCMPLQIPELLLMEQEYPTYSVRC